MKRMRSGFSIIELMVAMGIGGVLVTGMLGILKTFHKSTLQVKELGDFNTLQKLIFSQFSGTSCKDYFPNPENLNTGTNMNTATRGAKTNLTLLKNPLPSPRPIVDDDIRIKSDGTTRISGDQYLMVMTTTDNSCAPSIRTGPCMGTLSLVMNRTTPSSTPSGAAPNFLGVRTRTQDITHVEFNVDSSDRFTGCNLKSYAAAGSIRYDNDSCIFPPQITAPHPATWGGSDVRVTCPNGYIAVGACAARLGQVPPPNPLPSPAPAPTYTNAYCNSGTSGVTASLACCAMADPSQIKAGTSQWRNSKCEAGEVVTGICSHQPMPEASRVGGEEYIPIANCSDGKNVQCSPIAKMNMMAKYPFCHDEWIWWSNFTTCKHGEVMTEFSGLGANNPGTTGHHIKCCTVFP